MPPALSSTRHLGAGVPGEQGGGHRPPPYTSRTIAFATVLLLGADDRDVDAGIRAAGRAVVSGDQRIATGERSGAVGADHDLVSVTGRRAARRPNSPQGRSGITLVALVATRALRSRGSLSAGFALRSGRSLCALRSLRTLRSDIAFRPGRASGPSRPGVTLRPGLTHGTLRAGVTLSTGGAFLSRGALRAFAGRQSEGGNQRQDCQNWSHGFIPFCSRMSFRTRSRFTQPLFSIGIANTTQSLRCGTMLGQPDSKPGLARCIIIYCIGRDEPACHATVGMITGPLRRFEQQGRKFKLERKLS
jgi:hypothetical protein